MKVAKRTTEKMENLAFQFEELDTGEQSPIRVISDGENHWLVAKDIIRLAAKNNDSVDAEKEDILWRIKLECRNEPKEISGELCINYGEAYGLFGSCDDLIAEDRNLDRDDSTFEENASKDQEVLSRMESFFGGIEYVLNKNPSEVILENSLFHAHTSMNWEEVKLLGFDKDTELSINKWLELYFGITQPFVTKRVQDKIKISAAESEKVIRGIDSLPKSKDGITYSGMAFARNLGKIKRYCTIPEEYRVNHTKSLEILEEKYTVDYEKMLEEIKATGGSSRTVVENTWDIKENETEGLSGFNYQYNFLLNLVEAYMQGEK